MSLGGHIDLIWAICWSLFFIEHVFNQESYITIKKLQLTAKEQLQNNKM